MRFLLSIHDVWPGNMRVVEDHLRILKGLGTSRVALLVVPLYHGKSPVDRETEFQAWLRAKQSEGSEILLHGYRHLVSERVPGAGAVRRSRWGRWVNRRLVAGEAEFSGLREAEREALLAAGARTLSRAGFPARGFVAPTWHGAPSSRALAGSGIQLWESRFFLHHLPSGRRRFVPPLAWSPANREARLQGGEPWLRALLRLPLIKVALHPGDLDSPSVVPVLAKVAAAGREIDYASVFPA